VLLTTLFGGDVFEFIQADPADPFEPAEIVRVALHGDIVAELVGGDVNDRNELVIGDLPGLLLQSGTDRAGAEILGGRGGADGVEPIGLTSITDNGDPAQSIAAISDNITLNAMASAGLSGDGRVWGFNVGEITDGDLNRTVVQLVELSTEDGAGEVDALLHQATLGEDVAATLSTTLGDVRAVAVHPVVTSLMYVVSAEGGESVLYNVNRFSGVATSIGPINVDGTNLNAGDVEAMAFNASGELHIITHNADGDPDADAFALPDTFVDGVPTDVDGGTDTAVVNLGDPLLGPLDAALAEYTFADAEPISRQTVIDDTTVTVEGGFYRSLVFSPGSDTGGFAAAQPIDEPDATDLDQIGGIDGSGNASATSLGLIEAGGATLVHGLAFSQDIDDQPILVGIDHAPDDGPQLISIDTQLPVNSQVISPAGSVDSVFGLSSFTPDQGKPLLLSISETGDEIIRGSTVFLPLDLESGQTTISQILGAAFQPDLGNETDGELFFVATGGENELDRIYHLDVFAGSRSEVQNSLQVLEGNFGEEQVITAMAWDQTGANSADLVVYESSDPGQLGIVDLTDVSNTVFTVTPSIQGEPFGDAISAIAFPDDDPNAAEEFVVVIDNNENNLLRIRRVDAPTNAYLLGPLPDPDDIADGTDDPTRGEDLISLSWNPLLENPFTGEAGVLLATDGESDELVFVDPRPRLPFANAFAIYVTQAGPNAAISAAVVPDVDTPPEERVMQPFGGGSNVFRVSDAQTGELILIESDGGAGGALLGARSENLIPDDIDDEEDLIPFLDADLAESFVGQIGTRPAEQTDGSSNELFAGVDVRENLLDFVGAQDEIGDRLMLGNFDRVNALSVSRDGRIFAVDSDGVDINGEEIDGVEFAEISALTGNVIGAPGTLIDSLSGVAVTRLLAMDFGDADRNAATGSFEATGEDLFAVAAFSSPVPELELDDPDNLAPSGLDITGVAVTPGGTLYALADTGAAVELYRIRTGINQQITDYTLLGEIVASDQNDATDGLTELTNIDAIEADPVSGGLFVVATDPNTGNQAVFTLDPRGADLDGDGAGDDEVFATVAFEPAGLTNNPVVGLAIDPGDPADPDDTFIWMVQRIGGVDTLLSYDIANDVLSTVGPVEVDLDGDGVGDQPSQVEGMDFDSDGFLRALDRSDDRFILIDTGDPTASRPQTFAGAVAGGDLANLQGYTIGRNDIAFGVIDDGGVNRVFASVGELPSLGVIDVEAGEFTRISELPREVGLVNGMAFSPGTGSVDPDIQGLYVTSLDGRIWELDLALDAGGAVDSVDAALGGDVLQLAGGGDATVLNSIDFDASGTLFGQNAEDGTLVNVDLTGNGLPAGAGGTGFGTGVVEVATEVQTSGGSLRPTVGAIAYDSSRSVFFAADNAYSRTVLPDEAATTSRESAALMTLAGTTSDAAQPEDLERFMWGGTVTGRVQTQGSMDLFYAGWLLTGNTNGEAELGLLADGPSYPDNFFVAGDLLNLVTTDAVGADDPVDFNENGIIDVLEPDPVPHYLSGFDLQVDGRLGQILSLEQFFGTIEVENQADVPGFTTGEGYFQSELEGWQNFPGRADRGTMVAPNLDVVDGILFQNGVLRNNNGDFFNDTFETAHKLGALGTGVIGQDPTIRVRGHLSPDPVSTSLDNVDYYSVGLLAGQTITVRLQHFAPLAGGEGFRVGVFNPDGVLVATNNDDLAPDLVESQPFQVTADRPGEWRIAVGLFGDVDFTGGEADATEIGGYNLFIEDAGDIAFGGLRSVSHYFATGPGPLVDVRFGDIGSINPIANLILDTPFAGEITASNGSVRSIDVGQTGVAEDPEPGETVTVPVAPLPTIAAPLGSVGYLRSNAGALHLDRIDVGGDVQAAEAFSGFWVTQLNAGGGLGVIRAQSMTVESGSIINLNTDGFGNDGVLGLIDVEGEMIAPLIDTGLGGNVKFINVGGVLNQHPSFGQTPLEDGISTVWAPGASAAFTDDSGATFTIRPTLLGNEPLDENGDPINPHQLTTRVVLISGGGVVLVDVESDSGVSISTADNGGLGVAEVGTIIANGQGQVVQVTDDDADNVEDFELVPADEEDETEMHVRITRGGSDTAVDVYNVVGVNFDSIRNLTDGSIFNVRAESVGTLTAGGHLGMIGPVANTRLVPLDTAASAGDAGVALAFSGTGTFPFSAFDRTGIDITGDVISMRAGAAIGDANIGGSANSVQPNDDLTNRTGAVEGLAGSLVVNGNLNRFITGEGILPTGTGAYADGGLFVGGFLNSVTTGSNPAGSDIRGDIVAGTGIGTISLRNSSIIHADIFHGDDFEAALEFAGLPDFTEAPDSVQQPIFDIGRISISGNENAGIIGTQIFAADIGTIDVDGFGIFFSDITTANNGSVVDDISATGFGIHNTDIRGGERIDSIIARGDGESLSVLDQTLSVRQSQDAQFDAFSGRELSPLNDLHEFLGTSESEPTNEERTRAGLLDGVFVTAANDVDLIRGYAVQATGFQFNTFLVGSELDRLDIETSIADLLLEAGALGRLDLGTDVIRSDLTISGQVSRIDIPGSFLGDSSLTVEGQNAELRRLTVDGDMEAALTVIGPVGTVDIGGDMTGPVFIDGTSARGDALRRFDLGGSLGARRFEVFGDVGTIDVAGDLGDKQDADIADQLMIRGDIDRLEVGQGRGSDADGSTLALDVIVLGDLDRLDVEGRVTGNVTVTGELSRFMIEADEESGVNADPIPTRSLGDLEQGATREFDVTALAVTDADRMFAVQDDAGTFRLVEIPRLPNGNVDSAGDSFVDIGAITNGGGADVTGIRAMEWDPVNEVLYVVGSAADFAGGEAALFSVDPATGVAAPIGALRFGGVALDGTQSVRAIGLDTGRDADDADDDTLFAVLHDDDASPFPTDTLVTVPTAAAATLALGDRGTIEIAGGIDTDIVGLDVVRDRRDARLVAFSDDPAVDNDGQIIEIDPDDPGASVAISPAGAEADGLAGYTADRFGQFYAIGNDAAASQDRLLVSNFNLLEGRVAVARSIDRLDIEDGYFNGEVIVGRDLDRFNLDNGHFGPEGALISVLGDIDNVMIRDGDLHGRIVVDAGELDRLDVRGSDFSGSIIARTADDIGFDGSMLRGASIDVSGHLDDLEVGADVALTATIDAGSADDIEVGRDFRGSLSVGYTERGTDFDVDRHFGGFASFVSDVDLNVDGNFGTDATGAVLDTVFRGTSGEIVLEDPLGDGVPDALVRVFGDADATIDGNFTGTLVVQNLLDRFDAASIGNDLGVDPRTFTSTIAAGGGLDRFDVDGEAQRMLLQVGAAAGRDGRFDTADARELNRMADADDIMLGSLTDSIIAVGRHIDRFDLDGDMTDSTVSAGFVIDQAAIGQAAAAGVDLSVVADRDALRSTVDLFHGTIGRFDVGGTMVDSDATAGVDAGADGSFDDAAAGDAQTLLRSITGGASTIERPNAALDADSRMITDVAVDPRRLTTAPGSEVVAVSYDVADDALSPTNRIAGPDGVLGGPGNVDGLSSVVMEDGATEEIVINAGGEQITITLRGDGTLFVLDETDPDVLNSADAVIDALVAVGTTDRTRIEVTSDSDASSVSIGRFLTDDDATVRSFETNVNLSGDPTNDADDQDLWIDGGVDDLAVRDLSPNPSWRGRVGGEVDDLTIRTQGAGALYVGGEVDGLDLVTSTGITLLQTLSIAPAGDFSDSLRELAIHAAANGFASAREFAFDKALGLAIIDVNPDPNSSSESATVVNRADVMDIFTDALLQVEGLNDVETTGTILAVADALSIAPDSTLGPLADALVGLNGLAVDSSADLDGDGEADDRVLAVQTSELIGNLDLLSDLGDIVGLTLADDGRLLIVADTGGGTFELIEVARDADGDVTGTNSLGVIEDEGADPDSDADDVAMADLNAVEFDPETGRTFIIGTSANTGGDQRLFVLDTTEGGDADASAVGDVLIVPPGTQPLSVTPNALATDLQAAFLSDLGGLSITSFAVSPVEAAYPDDVTARQTGIFTNPSRLFNLPDGIVISTGDVADFGEGPNNNDLNTTAFDRPATAAQETLLDQVTGGTFDHFDAVQIDIQFDLTGGADSIFFDLAYGTEEFPEFLQGLRDPETGIDGLGVFLNGTNLAATEINGQPLNVDHPDIDVLPGTELDAFIAPGNSPRLGFSESLGVNALGNTLTIILADTEDAEVDTTVFLSELRGFNMPPAPLTDSFTALAMGEDLENPAQRALYAVVREGGTQDRLVKIDPEAENIDGLLQAVEEVGAVDLGLIEANDAAGNPVAVEVTGMDFNARGELIATAVDAAGDEFRLLVNLQNPEQSTLITQPGDDTDLLEGLTADEMSQFIGVIDNAGSNDQLVTFTGEPDRLVEIDTETGAVDNIIGTIVSANGDRYWDMIDQIAVDRDGNLFGLASDADGINEAFGADDGFALMRIESTDSDGDGIVIGNSPSLTNPAAGPVRLDAVPDNAAIDPSTAPINGMAFDPFGRLLVVQRDGGTDFLRQIDLDLNDDGGVSITDFGANNGEIDLDLDRDGTPDGVGTQILGIGFDQDFNLLALNLNDGGTPGDPTDDGTELIALDFQTRQIDQSESDGTLAEATETGLDNTDGTPEDGQIVIANATIGDDFASVVDDFDIYRVTLDADDVLTLDVLGGTLADPILGVYDAAGNQLLTDDESGRGDNPRLRFDVAADGVGAGDYFVIVAGQGSDLADPFDPDASSIVSATGTYQLSIGLNAGQTGQMLRTSAPAILPATLDAFAVGAQGEPFNTYAYATNPAGQNFGEAFINASALNPLPIDRGPENLIGGDLGGLFDIVGAAVVRGFGADDQFFAVHDSGGGAFELIEIVRDPDSGAVDGAATAATARPIIDGRLPGPNNVLGIDAIAGDNLGRMFAVGTQSADGPQTLYRIDPTVDTVANPTEGNAIQARVLVGDSAIVDPIVALAFDSTNVLYAAVDHGGGEQELIRINTADGTFTRVGEIRIDGRGADLQGFDFDENDQLFAINRGASGQRIVEIDVEEPETSTIVAREAAVDANLRGYAADPDGRFYSIYNDMDVDAQLWASPADNRVATVGVIDDDPASPTFGRFSQLAALTDQDGRPLDRGVIDIAVDEGEPIGVDDADQSFFALTKDSRLFEYDAATGGFLGQFGRVVNAAGETLSLNAIVVTDGADTDNDGEPDLVGFDTRFNQLVRIDPLTAVDSDGDGVNDTVTAQTLIDPGILAEFTIVDLTFDETSGRVVGVTDDPETFVNFPADLGDIEAGGINAYAFDRIEIENEDPAVRDGNYAGRLFATTEGFNRITMELAGQFNGEIVTPGVVERFDQREGDFNGTVSAGVAVERFQISDGDFLTQGVVLTDGLLDNFSMRDRDSLFAGTISAVQADRIDIRGAVLETGLISVGRDAATIGVDGAFEGDLALGSLSRSLDIDGTLGADARIDIADDAGHLRLDNGTAAGSIVQVGGAIDRLDVDETHRGVIASGQEIDRAYLDDITRGLLAVGTDSRTIRVDNLTDAVISLGVNIGADRTYNTADDEIVGGTADRIDVRGDMFDSAIAAGVLPALDSEARANTPNLPQQLVNFTGFTRNDPFGPSTFVDNAEIGGILDSGIERLSIRGSVNDSSFARSNVVAAAGPIEDIRGREADNLLTRVYDDPFGAPEIEAVNVVNNARFDVVFSEQVNTDSLAMSVDANNDGDVTDPGDTLGTFVLLDQDGNVIDDVDVSYGLRGPQGVMSVTRQAGFEDLELTVRFFGDKDGRMVHDHTGGRAAVRDFDRDGMPAGVEAAFGGDQPTNFGEDPFGSLLDGDRNDVEGIQSGEANDVDGVQTDNRVAERIEFFRDAPGSFANAPLVMNSLEPGNRFDRLTLANEFSSAGDVDVYRIEADAFDFLSLELFTDAFARMSLFVQDTNVLADPDDDTFEQIAVWEQNVSSFDPVIGTERGGVFQAYELVPMEADPESEFDTLDAVGLNTNPADGIQTAGLNYYIAITPLGVNPAADNSYELTITMAQTDDELDGRDDDRFAGPMNLDAVPAPQDRQIAYISNTLDADPDDDARGNELGFNEPKQLVYLNFTGGVSTQIDARGTDEPVDVVFDPFDVSQLDSSLAGLNGILLNGGMVQNREVTGVIETILSIYSDTPATTPFGGLNVQLLQNGNLAPFLASDATGLFFTTVEPNVPEGVEFSTVFIGPSDVDGEAAFLGLAQQIDLANLDKGDDAIVPTGQFAGIAGGPSVADRLDQYSTALANVIAHELGHILGLNHTELLTVSDDPDNNPATLAPPAGQLNLMSAGPNFAFPDDLFVRWTLGTAEVERGEFPIGDLDSVDSLLKWLGPAIAV